MTYQSQTANFDWLNDIQTDESDWLMIHRLRLRSTVQNERVRTLGTITVILHESHVITDAASLNCCENYILHQR